MNSAELIARKVRNFNGRHSRHSEDKGTSEGGQKIFRFV
jgi:hypothetical protein